MRIEKDQANTLIAVVGLMLAYGAVVWLPSHLERGRLRVRLDTAAEQVEMSRSQLQSSAELEREVKAMQASIDSQKQHLSGAGEAAEVVSSLGSAMERQGVNDPEVQTQPVIVGNDFCVAPVLVRYRGSFSQTLSLLKEIENGPRLMRVDRLDIVGSGKPGAEKQTVAIDLAALLQADAGGTR